MHGEWLWTLFQLKNKIKSFWILTKIPSNLRVTYAKSLETVFVTKKKFKYGTAHRIYELSYVTFLHSSESVSMCYTSLFTHLILSVTEIMLFDSCHIRNNNFGHILVHARVLCIIPGSLRLKADQSNPEPRDFGCGSNHKWIRVNGKQLGDRKFAVYE